MPELAGEYIYIGADYACWTPLSSSPTANESHSSRHTAHSNTNHYNYTTTSAHSKKKSLESLLSKRKVTKRSKE